jgi:hypothetical protein
MIFCEQSSSAAKVAKFLGINPIDEERISNQNINPRLNYVPI